MSSALKAPRGLSIRALLLGAHTFVWLLPLFALSMLRVYDVYLLRQTEHQLIAESVMVGEVFREAYLRALGRAGDNRIRPEDLNEVERRILKEAFRQARKLQQRLKLDYKL